MAFRFFLSFTIAVLTTPACADEGYSRFLKEQWSRLRFPVTMANERFMPPLEDLKWLNTEIDPVVRNRMINERYFELGESIEKCILGKQVDRSRFDRAEESGRIGNWYFIAAWASKSAGEVIDGSKFDPALSYVEDFRNAYQAGRISWKDLQVDQEIDRAYRLANGVISTLNLDEQKNMRAYLEEQKVIFGETNYVIAAEMIPIAHSFLSTFCECSGPDCRKEQGRFFQKFNSEETELKSAFEHYAEAVKASDWKRKLEFTLLASIEQVFHEQKRVQPNLWRSLNSPLVPTRILGPKMLTLSAGFFFGRQGIKLHRDIRAVTLAPELRELSDPRLTKLFQSLGLSEKDPGKAYRGSACKDWSVLSCRKKYLAPLFRELLSGEPDLYAFSK